MIDKSINGAVHFMASNNDSGVRDFDMERFQLSKHFCFPWPKNHTSLSPDGKLVVIVGDYPEGLLVDSQTGKTITPFRGHLDFSFASAWHPDGHIFATGNQDKTCRVWDFMAMAEPADFVHVYDAKHGFEKEQEIDFFAESLFIGVWDRTYRSLLQLNRCREVVEMDDCCNGDGSRVHCDIEYQKRHLENMSQYHGDEMEYAADDNEMAEVEEDMYFRGRAFGESDSDDDDDYEYDPLENRISDTTAAEARRGKDIQGIPWDRLSISREKYRQTRLDQYKNYENIPQSGEMSEKECKATDKGGKYYDFWQNTRSVKSTILHFQLRNLVWSTSKHDVYLVSNYSIVHWSSLTSKRSEVLNVSGHVAPCEKHPGSLLEGFTQTQISTLAVRDNLLIAGGFQGELICKYLDRPGVSFCTRTTYEDNAITNAVEIYEHPSGAVHFMASNNDSGVRDFDMERFQLSKHFCFPWPVNHTSLSPDGKLVVIVGDYPEGLLVDSQTGKTITPFRGHLDFSFASAWHPDGHIFATGNQDKTCRVWDVRNLSKSVAVLKGNLGAIRSIRFTSDGQFMAMAEPADFVHVYDAKHGFEKEQEIDFFGEISGVSFSPDTESLFIGVWDRTYGSLLQLNRRRNYMYLDCL
ncbi:putative WD repeat-containing protein C2A9.03 [Glycine max]|nr:putative WD repeat-containing protein C2A9.03 [Glycine max]